MSQRDTEKDEGQESQSAQDERRRLSDNVDEIVDEVNKTVRVAIVKGVDAAETIGDSIRDTIQGMRRQSGQCGDGACRQGELGPARRTCRSWDYEQQVGGCSVSDSGGYQGKAAAVRQNRGEDTGNKAGQRRASADGG